MIGIEGVIAKEKTKIKFKSMNYVITSVDIFLNNQGTEQCNGLNMQSIVFGS